MPVYLSCHLFLRRLGGLRPQDELFGVFFDRVKDFSFHCRLPFFISVFLRRWGLIYFMKQLGLRLSLLCIETRNLFSGNWKRRCKPIRSAIFYFSALLIWFPFSCSIPLRLVLKSKEECLSGRHLLASFLYPISLLKEVQDLGHFLRPTRIFL